MSDIYYCQSCNTVQPIDEGYPYFEDIDDEVLQAYILTQNPRAWEGLCSGCVEDFEMDFKIEREKSNETQISDGDHKRRIKAAKTD